MNATMCRGPEAVSGDRPGLGPRRVLLVSETFPPKTGGSSRWFWEIYRRLPHHRVVVAAGEDPQQDEFDRMHDLALARLPLTLRSWGVRDAGCLAGYWRAIRALRRLAQAEGVDMVHCGRCLPEGLMALGLKAWCGLSYACFAHGEELNYAASSRELGWLARRVLRGAVFVVANSKNTERILHEQWALSRRRIRVIHPGVDTDRFAPTARDPRVRAALGWGGRPVVLTVGRLQRRKGHDQMIRALRTVRESIPDVLYAIVGDGEEREYLRDLVDREGHGGHVQFLGALDDDAMVRCYQQCDLFVLPNRQVGEDIEGFGMVLVEAQACGKPVVAGASGGTAETIRIPETGRVIPCEGSGELAATVVELLGDRPLLDRMGAEARRWAAGHFDWSALGREAEGLLLGGLAAR
jgi:phosphatidyl-myo-inositol dimannoside synthase